MHIIRRLIVDRADRLSRRLAVTAQIMALLENKQVELVVVTDPNFGQFAGGRLASNILAAASEFQLDMTRERMSETRAALKSHGKRVAGPVPFGYRSDPTTKQLVQHPQQAVIVREIFKLASDGARPSDIAFLANLQNWLDGNIATGKWSSGSSIDRRRR
ncbi:MAG: recombinase family protein [Aureliella sp.]